MRRSSDSLADGARKLADGGNTNEVNTDTYNAIRRALSEALTGGNGSGAGQSAPGNSVRSNQAAGAAPGQLTLGGEVKPR